MPIERVRVPEAAKRLGKPASTIRVWATRYNVRRWKLPDGCVWFDYADLAAIDGHIYRGEPVPKTPEERDRLRANRRATAALAA